MFVFNLGWIWSLVDSRSLETPPYQPCLPFQNMCRIVNGCTTIVDNPACQPCRSTDTKYSLG